MQSVNPATEEIIGKYTPHSQEEVNQIIDHTHTAYSTWRQNSLNERAALLRRIADLLEHKKEAYAELMTREMGKASREGIAEIEKCAWVCRYYADHGATFLKDEPAALDNGKSFITYQPLGVILAIMPWNFPFWQVFRFAAPTLMAGNAAILKHASNVCGCALAIESLFKEANAPKHLFRSILVSGKDTKQLIEHKHVQAVTLTGSTEAGKSVAATAGAALKKTVLELGGSDPYIILKDADIELAAKKCTQSRMINAGQSCIAAKRMIVVENVYDIFIKAFTHEMQQITMGNPLDNHTDIGPQASIALRDQLHAQVQASLKAGARCILGGEIPPGKGAFYPPTILVDVDENCPAYHEELFGPVATVIRAKNTQEALRIANESVFGLGGAIFSSDIAKAEQLAATQLQTGTACVNDFVKSDPRLPFGGIKQSGYGRELAQSGIREFVNIKSVHVASANT